MTQYNSRQMVTGTSEAVLAGAIATAPSFNTILGPQAHLAARIVPIYAIQPTAPVAGDTWAVQEFSGSQLQTHGLWCTGTYGDVLTSMSMSMACGFTRDFCSIAATTDYDHRIVMSRPASNWTYLTVDGGISHSLTASSQQVDEPMNANFINATILTQISRGQYNSAQYQARYGNGSYCQFTTKDLCGALFYESVAPSDETKSIPTPRQFTALLNQPDTYDEADRGWVTTTLTSSLPSDSTFNPTAGYYYVDRFTVYGINALTDPDPTS